MDANNKTELASLVMLAFTNTSSPLITETLPEVELMAESNVTSRLAALDCTKTLPCSLVITHAIDSQVAVDDLNQYVHPHWLD